MSVTLKSPSQGKMLLINPDHLITGHLSNYGTAVHNLQGKKNNRMGKNCINFLPNTETFLIFLSFQRTPVEYRREMSCLPKDCSFRRGSCVGEGKAQQSIFQNKLDSEKCNTARAPNLPSREPFGDLHLRVRSLPAHTRSIPAPVFQF